MIRQYYTLEKITAELQCLWGYELKECFSQEKDTVILVFTSVNDIKYLQYSSDNILNSVFLRNHFKRARKNTVNLLPDIIGETVQEINLLTGERILNLKLIYTDIYFTLFGGPKNNLFVVNNDNVIIDTLYNPKNFTGTEFKLKSNPSLSIFDFSPDTKIIKAISNSSGYAGNYYAEEICCRMGISPDLLISEFSSNDLLNIENQILHLRQQCNHSQYSYILQNSSGNTLLSLIPLIKYPLILNKFTSVCDAVERRVIDIIMSSKYEKLHKEIKKKLYTLKHKLQKSIAEIQNRDNMLENSVKYRQWAELLISQPEQKVKPGTLILINDYEENEIAIPLDSKWTIAENARYYFEKAKNDEKKHEIRKKQLPGLLKKLGYLEIMEKQFFNANSFDELNKIRDELFSFAGDKSDKSTKLTQKFRKFYLGEGFELYVGKNASNNDDLTFKFAKPYDLWLHARGAAGSHCVIPLSNTQKLSKIVLQRAASIAAYYSQARGSKYVPVVYTYRKYVRKPKGSNIGSVVISREEIIMAEPYLPEVDLDL